MLLLLALLHITNNAHTMLALCLHNTHRRNELFRMSGIRANYPQFFLVNEDGSLSFLGDWDRIEGVNDASALPTEILEANPGIITWDSVLG
jgi:hypothetical protein